MVNLKEKKINIIDMKVNLDVSVEDIIIGEEVTYEQFLDNEINYRKKMTRRYSSDNKNSKIILMINEELAPKYVLQDIAFEYGKRNLNPILLLIGSYVNIELTNLEKQHLREEGLNIPKSKKVFRIYFINTKEPFNHHLYGKIDIEVDEKTLDLKITKEINFKINTLLNHFDFFTDSIHIISPESDFGYILDFIKKHDKFIDDIKFLDKKETITTFNFCKPFEKMSKSKQIMILGIISSLIFVFILFNYLNDFTQKIQATNEKEIEFKELKNKRLENDFQTEKEKYLKMLNTLDENKILLEKKDIK